MQDDHQKSKEIIASGFLHKLFKFLNLSKQKPVFWVVLFSFAFMALLGYWLGKTLVLEDNTQYAVSYAYPKGISNRTYLLLEVDDLSVMKPRLQSIWFVHLQPGENNRLGFTHIVSQEMIENDYYTLLDEFSLDSNKNPSPAFMKLLSKSTIPTQDFVLIDKISTSAIINWFEGKELSEPLEVDLTTISQYGKVLRGLCASLSMPSERGNLDFQWFQVAPDHFSTSIEFMQVIEDISFLTAPTSPICEMTPLH